MTIPRQKIANVVLDDKYLLKDGDTKIDQDLAGQRLRVARNLASVERTQAAKKKWEKEFSWALANGAVPAGRIMSNAGASKYKPNVSLINCTVSGTIEDSLDDILLKLHEGGLTLKHGCGIGYDFSTLRYKGATVAGAGAKTSGPLSFMEIYNSMCSTIRSAGDRRGAQMGTLHLSHPDALAFISAKEKNGEFDCFNTSLLVPDSFMDALAKGGDWDFTWNGEVVSTMPAAEVWDKIMYNTYNHAEPGILFVDRINDMNPLYFAETISCTNPCAEQPLPPYGSCLLGSINLVEFITSPFTPDARFDQERFESVVRVFTRMLDNVVEVANLPLEEQAKELANKRRHGMGYMGMGSAISMLGWTYGDKDSTDFAELIGRTIARLGFEVGIELAREKGCAPILAKSNKHRVTARIARLTGLEEGKSLTARRLYIESPYVQSLLTRGVIDDKIIEGISRYGLRYTHHSSIAPTGTIALAYGNNVSNGIEPDFEHHAVRNMIVAGHNSKQEFDVYSYTAWAFLNTTGRPLEELPKNCVVANTIPHEDHIAILRAAQPYLDSSISKTINVATDMPFEEFKSVYLDAYKSGLKGCTTFRFNAERYTGVIVRREDLAATTYRFDLADGSKVEVSGDTMIEYEGQSHLASNLADAIRNGQYGKF